MKKPIQLLVASAMLMLLINACNQNHNTNPALIGNWKMNALHIKQFDDQMAQMQGEIKSLTDSLTMTTDTAAQKRIQENLASYKNYLADMQARKDSSLTNTFWNFKGDGTFQGQESGNKKYSGYWEYHEKSKTITRYLPSDSVKVDVKGDTLILNLDSINHITFVKSASK